MFRAYASQYAAKTNKSQNKHERCKHLSDRLNLITKARSFSYGLCIISTVEVFVKPFQIFCSLFSCATMNKPGEKRQDEFILKYCWQWGSYQAESSNNQLQIARTWIHSNDTASDFNLWKLHLLFSKCFKCQTCK